MIKRYLGGTATQDTRHANTNGIEPQTTNDTLDIGHGVRHPVISPPKRSTDGIRMTLTQIENKQISNVNDIE